MKKFFFPDAGVTIEAETLQEAVAKLAASSVDADGNEVLPDGVESPRKKKRPSPR